MPMCPHNHGYVYPGQCTLCLPSPLEGITKENKVKHVSFEDVKIGQYFRIESYTLNKPVSPSDSVFIKLDKIEGYIEYPIIQVYPKLGTRVHFWDSPVFLLED